MKQSNPYFLTVRPFTDGYYNKDGKDGYIRDGSYGLNPSNYIRAYLLLQKDVTDIFDYIEPSDINLKTYSMRIQALILRVCTEVEANFKAILKANSYSSKSRLNISDYHKIDQSHLLSRYSAKYPFWNGDLMQADRTPFEAWANPKNVTKPYLLPWYQDYNTVKHDRVNSMHLAHFENLLDSFAALTILIASQYFLEDFTLGPRPLLVNAGWSDGYDTSIGNYMRIRFPRCYEPGEDEGCICYDFNWEEIHTNPNPFQTFNYK